MLFGNAEASCSVILEAERNWPIEMSFWACLIACCALALAMGERIVDWWEETGVCDGVVSDLGCESPPSPAARTQSPCGYSPGGPGGGELVGKKKPHRVMGLVESLYWDCGGVGLGLD